jgi:hypothetical protein
MDEYHPEIRASSERRMMRKLIPLIAAGVFCVSAASAMALPAAPTLTVEEGTLNWSQIRKTTEYQLRIIYPETHEHSETVVTGLSYTPTLEAGTTVEYRVRAFSPTIGEWSNRVRIVPLGEREHPGEEEQPGEEEHSGEEEAPNCTKYASTNGSDADEGSAARPFRTIDHLLGSLSAGQTGCLFPGQTFDEEVQIGAYTTSSEREIAAVPHGEKGAPITITSVDPREPATIARRITLLDGANWITFDHLTLKSDVPPHTEENPSPTINSEHTAWTNDDISGGDIDICIAPNGSSVWGQAVDTLIENDRVHDCGHPVTDAELLSQAVDLWEEPLLSGLFRLNGWHAQGIYDQGQATTVRNSYFYDNSRNGILLRGGKGAVVEHNILDGNGEGVLFGNLNDRDGLVAWNIITGSNSPCDEEGHDCDDYGINAVEAGAGNVARNNDVFENADGNISAEAREALTLQGNVEVDPQYTNAARHNYTLLPTSPVLGYGPDTAQP